MIADFLTSAATLWQYWNNPFLLRCARTDWRGRSWITTFAVQFGLLAAIVWCVSGLGSLVSPRGFPEWWGGSWGGLAIVLLSLVHFGLIVVGSAVNRRRELLTDEARLGTLEPLLVTPMSRADIILKSSVYPFLWGTLVAAVAFPLYMVCAAVGDVAYGTIAGLYVLYLALAFRPPVRLRHSVLAHTQLQQVVVVIGIIAAAVAYASAGPGGLRGTIHSGGIVLTWVFELARWLGTPAPFFAFRLPPLVLVLVLYPMHVACGILMASAELETESRGYLEALQKVRFWYRLLVVTSVIGLAWEPVWVQGSLDQWLGVGGGPAGALGFALAAAVAAVAGSEVLETARTRLDVCATLGVRLRLGRTAWHHIMGGVLQSLSAVLIVPPLHLLLCGMAVEAPYLVGGGIVFAAMLVAGIAIVFCYALGLLLWLGLGSRRWAYRAAFLSVVATLVGLPLAGAGAVGGVVSGWIAAISPVSAFAALTSGGTSWLSQLGAAVPSVGVCLAIQLGLALGVLVLDARILDARLRQRSRGASPEASMAMAVARERPSLLERHVARSDNPVVVAACRGMARTGAHLVVIVLMGLGLLVCVGLALSSGVSVAVTPALARGWTGPSEPVGWRLLQIAAAGGGLLAAVAMGLSGASAFGEERRRQTFGFVLLTPLTDREIIEGRWLVNALPVGIAYVVCVAVSAVGVVLSPSALSVTQWAFNTVWGALVAAAAGYMGLAGSLGRTVSEGNAALSTFIVLGVVEGIGLGGAGLSRLACNGYPSLTVWLAPLFGLALLGIALLFGTVGRSAALSALRSLRASDPFTT